MDLEDTIWGRFLLVLLGLARVLSCFLSSFIFIGFICVMIQLAIWHEIYVVAAMFISCGLTMFGGQFIAFEVLYGGDL